MLSEHPFDALVTAVFAQPAHAATLFKAALPSALHEALVLSPTTTPLTYRMKGTSQRYDELSLSSLPLGTPPKMTAPSDVNTQCEVPERPDLQIFIHRQATDDASVGIRVFSRSLNVWDEWGEAHPDTRLFPQVLPVVLYHGAEPWQGPTCLFDLVATEGLPPSVKALVRATTLDLHFLVVDLRSIPDDTLAIPGMVRLTLLLLKHAEDPAWGSRVGQWADDVRHVAARGTPGLRDLSLLVECMKRSDPPGTNEGIRAFLAPLDKAEQELVMAMGSETFH